MKYFPWTNSAVQALATDKVDDRNAAFSEASELAEDESEVKQIYGTPASSITLLDGPKSVERFSEETETAWNDEDISVVSWGKPIPQPQFRQLSTENLPMGLGSNNNAADRLSSTNSRGLLSGASRPGDYNPSMAPYIYHGQKQNPQPFIKRNMSSTSVIFKDSSLTPIMITVTTPDEPSDPLSLSAPARTVPRRNSFNQIREQRRSSSSSLKRATSVSSTTSSMQSSPASLKSDSSRLMPPTAQQNNSSRHLKGQESQEIREFLIQFMESKGYQFPRMLRGRMMQMYGITDADLSPSTIAKFAKTDGLYDEGIALERLGISKIGHTDAEDLQILQRAFSSLISFVTPDRPQSAADSIRNLPVRSRSQGPVGRHVETSKEKQIPMRDVALAAVHSAPVLPARYRNQSLKERRVEKRIEQQRPVKDEELFAWLGPLITTTVHVAPPLNSPPPRTHVAATERKLMHASSEPNMRKSATSHRKDDGDRPAVPSIPSDYWLGGKRGRNTTLSETSRPVVGDKTKDTANMSALDSTSTIHDGALGKKKGSMWKTFGAMKWGRKAGKTSKDKENGKSARKSSA